MTGVRAVLTRQIEMHLYNWLNHRYRLLDGSGYELQSSRGDNGPDGLVDQIDCRVVVLQMTVRLLMLVLVVMLKLEAASR
jgi:hypothetical protein